MYADLVGGEKLVTDSGYEFTGFASDPRLKPTLKLQADTTGRPVWVDSPTLGMAGGDLIGYPAYEWSDYSSAVTTPTSTVATIGDFNQFMIIDRIGMSVEVIPHMFHTSNNLPSGQRGLFAYWRNTSDVTVAAAFRHIRIS